eukprot:IDg16114t1
MAREQCQCLGAMLESLLGSLARATWAARPAPQHQRGRKPVVAPQAARLAPRCGRVDATEDAGAVAFLKGGGSGRRCMQRRGDIIIGEGGGLGTGLVR